MKLTNTIRDAFVRSAMNDVPSVDYAEQIRAATLAAVLNVLPKAVQTMYKDEKTRLYLKHRYATLSGRVSVAVPWGDEWGNDAHIRAAIGKDDLANLDALGSAMKSQEETRRTLQDKLKGCAYSVTTRKALVNLLPEFEKYLPADEPAALRTLPVVANVVADFVKAGWPKNV